jgi:alpha-beta hydrolase superfamily lysophospholipase
MPTNHTTSIEIKHGKNTHGYFSFEEPENLVVFVHGFGGNALATWNNFPSILIFDDKFKTSDIIYYGYDTFSGQAGDHAVELYHFLNLLQKPLEHTILPVQQHLAERTYKKVFLVAHSLGAVLVRQAQLLAYIDRKPWVDNSFLALFAPAHNGANVISLAMEALPGLFKLAGLLAKFKFPILSDLDANDDGILKAIKAQTESLQNQGKADFSKAKLVVYAKGDKVIKNIPYLYDTPPEIIPKASHTSVCKPTETYARPLELLKDLL